MRAPCAWAVHAAFCGAAILASSIARAEPPQWSAPLAFPDGTATPQTEPVLAPAAAPGGDTLVVYSESANEYQSGSLRAARLAQGGVLRDTPPLHLGAIGVTPAAAWLGEAWAVAFVSHWNDPTLYCGTYDFCQVHLVRVDPSGAPGGAIEISRDGRDPTVASLGDGGLAIAAWSGGGLTGVVLDARAAVVGELELDLPGESPRLVGGDGAYLLAWRSPGDGILVVRLGPDGTRLDDRVARLPGFLAPIAAAWTGSGWVVAWRDDTQTKIARVSVDGEVLDAPPAPLVPEGDAVRSVLAPWGTALVALFVDRPETDYRAMGLSLGPDLRWLDEEPWTLAALIDPRSRPALAATATGELVAATTVYDDTPGIESNRLRVRVAPAPAPEQADGGADGSPDPGTSTGGVAGGGACTCNAVGGRRGGGTALLVLVALLLRRRAPVSHAACGTRRDRR